MKHVLPTTDWLGGLLALMPVAARVDVRRSYGAPWKVVREASCVSTLPYYVVLRGTACLDNSRGARRRLTAGDVVVLPDGDAHTLHDGCGIAPAPIACQPGSSHVGGENEALGERLDLLSGHFAVPEAYGYMMRRHLPSQLVVHCSLDQLGDGHPRARVPLARLVELMRSESDAERLGGLAVLDAFSAALFTLSLRLASEEDDPAPGLLALAGHPQLVFALSAMFRHPAYPWTLPELASLCNMSRATFARHFRKRAGCSAADLLLDVRMAVAASELSKPDASLVAVARTSGYRSDLAFRRAFKRKTGLTPAQWRSQSHSCHANFVSSFPPHWSVDADGA